MATSPAAARVLAQVGIFRDDIEPERPTLPLNVSLFTMTEHELFDLVFAATSQRMQLHGTKARAHELATEVANQASVIALASDYRHEGPDPRA